MSLQLVTGPASGSLPVSLEEFKRFASVSNPDRDDLLSELLAAAVGSVEEILGRALATQTWLLGLDQFASEIVLPKGPVQAVSWIRYRDRNRVEQTLSNSVYVLDLVNDPARIVVADGQAWPALGNYPSPVRVQFVTGYADADDVPRAVKTAIKMTALSLFENRTGGEVPAQAMRMLEPWRSGWFQA